ncbi:MAG: thiamine phosphate synthase [Chlorobium sp.]|nr:MAG: thiamine phosphate synthase [Chlorobium sp.]
MIPSPPFLCVITDEALCPVSLAEKALEGGAAMIQLRHKSASGSQLYSWAIEIVNLTKRYNALCIINDRVDIAMASRANGVHLGQQDMPALVARKIMDKSTIIGVSTSSIEEAIRAEKDGADYIGFGHIYPTSSKEKGYPPLGPEALQEVSKQISLPIVAIGGVSLYNAALLLSCGASGVAVISEVSRAVDPSLATRKLVSAINKRDS